ncbi:MAG TPA: hypothetical protein PKM44_16925 [Turneriella sp.]|nr:hypothetical protein [Turneriella sp.]HNE20984.1 hypothetical protein [Turneriella sp.]HNJ66466.1 hypothetical protein [Turneriella sp.]HNL12198.1 hypothetical protein [Turneriella sp.]HNL55206.1 hypothetical protein [Turneriella sp.]
MATRQPFVLFGVQGRFRRGLWHSVSELRARDAQHLEKYVLLDAREIKKTFCALCEMFSDIPCLFAQTTAP